MGNSSSRVFPNTHARTARMKQDKETEEGKKRGVSTGRRKAGTKKIHWAYHYLKRGRVDDLPFFDYSSPFYFLLIEFHRILFPYLVKEYNVMFINILFWLGSDKLSGLLSFVPALLFSILTPLFLPSSSVSQSYFIFAAPMRESLGKH